ncbi:MAG TPA: hypothetical protein VNT75_07020 [Symbiobacteriaceae bacterium]|nr:hypothetical protein [Symbiobacteriaceae bacterium]
MRKWMLLLAAAALLTGCAKPAPTAPPAEAEAPAPPPAAPAPAPAPAPPERTPVTGPAVDWFDAFDPRRPETVAPLTDNACPTDGTGQGLRTYDPAWRIHPLSKGKRDFYVPTVDAIVCNLGNTATKNQTLTLSETWQVRSPDLQPGQAAGPLRIYSASGVPDSVMQFWTAGGKQPPNPRAEIPRDLPKEPTAADLRQLAWSQGKSGQVELFLYAPDAAYSMATDYYCGALPGAINAKAREWAIYTITGGGAPAKAGEIGERAFEGNRGMKVEPAPTLGVTFLLFANYGSCANPNWYQIHAYDHATGKVQPVQMQREDGKVSQATVTNYTFSPDGKLTNKYYNNADGIGWHTDVYTWEPSSFTWTKSP